jgi:hypothetical protein
LVKNVRKTTVLPNQRMHASSKKRITKLMINKSRYTLLGELGLDEASVLAGDSVAMWPPVSGLGNAALSHGLSAPALET